MITVWERLGFVSDEYANTGGAPGRLGHPCHRPRPALPVGRVSRAGVGRLAGRRPLPEAIFEDGAPGAPDHVILGLTPALSPNIAGLAYYKVIRRQDDYDAIALGTHFRPHQALERADKRRLL